MVPQPAGRDQVAVFSSCSCGVTSVSIRGPAQPNAPRTSLNVVRRIGGALVGPWVGGGATS